MTVPELGTSPLKPTTGLNGAPRGSRRFLYEPGEPSYGPPADFIVLRMYSIVRSKEEYDLKWFDYLGMCCTIIVAAYTFDRFEIAQKWIVPTTCLVMPTWCSARFLQSRWNRRSFWISLILCATLLGTLLSFIFGTVLRNLTRVNFVLALPAALAVLLPFYVSVEALERTLRSDVTPR